MIIPAFEPVDQKLLTIFRESPFAVMLVDDSDNIIEASESAKKLFSIQKTEPLNVLVHDLPVLSDNDRMFLKDINARLVRDELMVEGVLHVKNDKESFQKIHVTATRISQTSELFMYLFTYKDIALQMTIEKELRDKEKHYKELLESSPYAIMLVDRGGIIIDYNEGVRSLLGKEKQRITGGHVNSIVLPYVKEKRLCISRFTRTFRGEITKPFKITVNDGKKNYYVLEIHLTLLEKRGDPYAIQVLCRDITKSEQFETTLKRVAQQWTTTFDAIRDGVCLLDMDKKILRCNRAFADMFNKEFANIIGYSCQDIVGCFPDSCIKCPIDQMIEESHRVTYSVPYDKVKWLSITANPIYDDDRNLHGTVLVVSDITNQRKLEEEILKGQKLESIGIMAGGIAHDFNNILCSILGNIEILKVYASPDDKNYARLSKIDKATHRARDLVQQLLTFSKGGAPVRETASIVDVITDTSEFVCRGSNVSCNFHVNAEIWPVEVDVNQISQVINNIILNAMQAMEKGGTIDISFSNVVSRTDDGLPLKPAKYVKIDIQDYGSGIAAEYIGKIFDPYFTTKPKGTGLGLATSYSIIKRHHGYITVSSEMNRGSIFSIYLIASEKSLPRENASEPTIYKGNGRLLIMDDEQPILDMLVEMLSICGYKVTTALDGNQTIELYKHARAVENPYDLVIVDLTIPGGMGGRETLAELRKIDADVKVIVSSGYSSDPVLANYRAHGFDGAITKPFKIKEMSKVIFDIIDGKMMSKME